MSDALTRGRKKRRRFGESLFFWTGGRLSEEDAWRRKWDGGQVRAMRRGGRGWGCFVDEAGKVES